MVTEQYPNSVPTAGEAHGDCIHLCQHIHPDSDVHTRRKPIATGQSASCQGNHSLAGVGHGQDKSCVARHDFRYGAFRSAPGCCSPSSKADTLSSVAHLDPTQFLVNPSGPSHFPSTDLLICLTWSACGSGLHKGTQHSK